MSGKRLSYVDMAKGIAILMILLYHLTAPGAINTVCAHLSSAALVLFFFCSGFFYRPGKHSFPDFLKSRAKALIVPFFKYSLLFWLVATIYYVATGRVPFVETLYCLRNFFGGCIWNRVIQGWFGWEYYSLGKRYFFLADFWFLPALFFSGILFRPIADAVLHSKGKTLLAAAALFVLTGVLRVFGVMLPYNLQIVPFWSAFLLLGAFAGQNGTFEIDGLSDGLKWLVAVGALGIGIAVSMLMPANTSLFRGSFSTPEVAGMLLVILSSLLTIWGLMELCYLVELSGARVKELAWLGSHTMTVYVYHTFIAWVISILFGFSMPFTGEADGKQVALSLLLSCVVLAVCIIIDVLKDRIAHRAKT